MDQGVRAAYDLQVLAGAASMTPVCVAFKAAPSSLSVRICQRGGILKRNGIMRPVVTRREAGSMDQEAVRDFLRDTREKRLAIAAAKEYMERTEQDVQTVKSICMDTKVQTNHQFDLAEFVERLEEAKLAYLKSYEAWITRAGVVYRLLDAAGCHAELWATISRRYLWACPWDDVAKQLGVSRRMASMYERRAITRIAASEAAGEIIIRVGAGAA